MIIHFYIIIALTVFYMKGNAQQQWCGANERIKFLDENIYREAIAALTDHTKSNHLHERSEIWLPVVVHVVTRDPQEFNYARILQQIDVLNRDFANKSDNIFELNDEFAALAADTEIRFCLATQDPEGNPTNGITYTQTDIDNIALERDFNGRYVVYYDQLGGKTGWDPQQYINIWIAEFGNGILGYGSLPGTAPYPEENGIVMDPLYFGAFGKSVQHFDRGHSLTHEMGHYLGLIHIWGDDDGSCNGSDEVSDTPNAADFYTGCPEGTQVTCDVSNMYQNFMDLTDDRCLAAFTHGQAMRMQSTLDLFYPQLAMYSPCRDLISNFDQWWNDLVWAYDNMSDEYVIYAPAGFTSSIAIDIFSSDGRRIRNDVIEGQQSYFIDVDAVPGVYFVRMRIGDNENTRKIVIY